MDESVEVDVTDVAMQTVRAAIEILSSVIDDLVA